MITYRIDDMTCGGCLGSIRRAVAAVAPRVAVSADLAARRVWVDGAGDAPAITAAIVAAGFHPVGIEAESGPDSGPVSPSGSAATGAPAASSRQASNAPGSST